ncbi:MAG: ribonuclease III [Pseudomonadales bacterium]
MGYRFEDAQLLERALTHKSYAKTHNERLEFLGDAVLGYVVANALYGELPDAHEHAMSLLRANLVRKETLADVAKEVELGSYLRLGAGARRSGGHRLDSILADALEALIGAVHLDGGIEPARTVILRLLESRMRDLDPEALKDAKTRLQELLQGDNLPLPEYAIESTAGSAHAKVFTVSCRVSAYGLEVTGEGRSRRAAEKQAAALMLERVAEHAHNDPVS